MIGADVWQRRPTSRDHTANRGIGKVWDFDIRIYSTGGTNARYLTADNALARVAKDACGVRNNDRWKFVELQHANFHVINAQIQLRR